MIPTIRPEDLTTSSQFAARLGLALHTFHARRKAGKLVLPAPFMRSDEGARGSYLWRTADVEPYTRTVSWTDEAGHTKVGPYAVLAMHARARGVIVPDSFATLAAAPQPAEDSLPAFTGDFGTALPNGVQLPDVNYLNAEPDQLTGEVLFQPVHWISDSGEDLGVRPLVEHMQDRQAAYGITPNRDVLDPSTPAEGK